MSTVLFQTSPVVCRALTKACKSVMSPVYALTHATLLLHTFKMVIAHTHTGYSLILSLELLNDPVSIEQSLVSTFLDIWSWFGCHSHPPNTANALLDGHEHVEHLARPPLLTVLDHSIHFLTQWLAHIIQLILTSACR